jgi:hypothetical protein
MNQRIDVARLVRSICGILGLAGGLAGVTTRAAAQIAVVGNTVEERSSHPGDSYVGGIVVQNLTNVAQPVRIYQTDYMFFADGTSRFDAPGSVARSNASWITPATSSTILSPLGQATIAYTVRVPANDSLRGTYWSTIMVEGAVNVPTFTGKKEMALGSVLRYSVQIATQIDAPAIAKAVFEKQQLETSARDSVQMLAVDVRNAGDKGLRPLLWVALYDSNGSLRTRFKQQRGLLYPGTSVRQLFPLGRLTPGTYKAVVFADIHEDAVTAAQYTLRF